MPPSRPRIRLVPAQLPAIAAMVAATLLLVRIAGQLLPDNARWLGHDYSYFFPYMVAGNNWIRLHGWAPPLFTPEFCGGLPWLANPQSMFYSVPQWLSTVTTPIAAVRWTLILFATLGASGMFGLIRRGFNASIEAAALGFVLFELNGFLIFRMAVGHVPFHVFGLVPIVAMLMLWPASNRSRELRIVAIAALCLAAMVYAGAGVMIVPIVLAVAAVIALAQLRSDAVRGRWRRYAASLAWSIPLAAFKLVPALVLVSRYPRADGPGVIASPATYITQFARSLFVPETLQPFFRLGALSLNQHELEYGVSVVPLLLVAAVLVLWIRKPHGPRQIAPVIGLVAIVAVVTALSLGDRRWSGLLHHLPVISNISIGMRWWIVWMLALIAGGALAIDALVRTQRMRAVLVLASVAVVMLQAGTRSLSRYTEPTTFSVYDPAPATAASAAIARGHALPAIAAIARPVAERSSEGVTPWVANDGVFKGTSTVPCYEPLFDHDLRLFPATLLHPGPVDDAVAPDRLNLADPRCYLDASCKPGSTFRAAEIAELRTFAAHQPLPWRAPWWQRMAGWCTVLAMIATIGAIIAPAVMRIRPVRAPAPGPRSA